MWVVPQQKNQDTVHQQSGVTPPLPQESVTVSNEFKPRDVNVANPEWESYCFLTVKSWVHIEKSYYKTGTTCTCMQSLQSVREQLIHSWRSVGINRSKEWKVYSDVTVTSKSSRSLTEVSFFILAMVWREIEKHKEKKFQLFCTSCTVYLRSRHRWRPSCENL